MKLAIAAILTGCLLCAQQPQVESAKLDTRAFAGSLSSLLSGQGAGPFWAAWSEPIIPGRHGDMCEHASTAPIRLEGQIAVVIMVRVENAVVDQLRVASPDCRFDAGGLPFHWIESVPPAESVAWLKTQMTGKHTDTAILAIALQSGSAADRALDDLIATAQPERIREKTAFWLGSTRGAHGVEMLRQMLSGDPSQKVREQVVFALSQSHEPSGMAAVIDAARTDKDPRVRSRALFWLAQKAADKQAQEVISAAVVNDPDRAVKEQAVFALKQLPGEQGVPLLIGVARNNPDPEIRKKAMFWLGQSTDPRALDYFAQVLKTR